MRFLNCRIKKVLGCALLIVAVSGFVACKRQCTYVCDEPYFGITFKGFQEEDLDTVIIKRYFSDGKFDELSSVTTMYDVFYHGFGRYDPVSDWEFYIPATQKTYRFSEISREGKETLRGECKTTRGCINEFFSYRLNGEFLNQSYGEIVK
jgi:hypothetical protein